MTRFKLTSSKVVLETPIFGVTHDRAEASDGTTLDRKVVRHPGAVAILLRNEHGEVMLVRQFRLPPRRPLWELPAGTLDPGETPNQTARRELAEETGYRARSWRKLFGFYPSPGFCDEWLTVFLAEHPRKGKTSPESYEKIETAWVRWADAITMVATGKIKDGKTLSALLYADRFLSRPARE